jgi:hypothetical protein
VTRHDFTLTVDASGNATVTSTDLANGYVHQIRYVPDGSIPLATGADLTITAAGSGLVIDTLTDIGTSAVQWAPRQATSTVAGAASLYAAGGTAVTDKIAVANERIQVAVAQGGVSKTGTLYIWVG